jgi:hypothetical protein
MSSKFGLNISSGTVDTGSGAVGLVLSQGRRDDRTVEVSCPNLRTSLARVRSVPLTRMEHEARKELAGDAWAGVLDGRRDSETASGND